MCPLGHDYDNVPSRLRRVKGNGCPYCGGQKALAGFNSITDLYPDVAAEWHPSKNGLLRPTDLRPGSDEMIFWLCKKRGHTFEAMPKDRCLNGVNCGYCRNLLVDASTNSLAATEPAFIAEWDEEGNGELTPWHVTAGSDRKVRWICAEHGSYEEKLYVRVKLNRGCPYCRGKKVHPTTSLAATDPVLASRWHPTKNGLLTPSDVFAKSRDKAWWTCPRHGLHVYEACIYAQRGLKGCPFCAGKAVNASNSMRTTHPHLAAEFHPTMNGARTPDNTTAGASKLWWLCELGHHWEAQGAQRSTRGTGCPYCSNRLVWVGFNDMATTHPHLVNEWDFERNHPLLLEEVVAGTNKRIHWKCRCGYRWRAAGGDRVTGHGCNECNLRRRRQEASRPSEKD
ncbi:zinc-ribbon domain-containing protein [Microbacterium testaceum]|uniref:zinc-ribbon domain-containing protein n=1 Tax=Microbacterium testaceum TaxID=2033 RepID=UPI001CD9B35C